MLSPLYMAEISPPELRGSLVALEQLAIVLGVVLGFWAGFFTRSSIFCLFFHASRQLTILLLVAGSLSWRIPLAIQLIPGVLLSIGCLLLPPSPRLLVSQGRINEARHSLAKLRGIAHTESHILLRVSSSLQIVKGMFMLVTHP
jgi:MFS family permease